MSNYWDKMKLNPSDMNKDDIKRRREAYNLAHEIRKFEIGLFWQRATYYWAFILAAFTSHFALIGLLFNSNKDKKFSIPELYNLPGLSLFALAITAFFCYFFSLCWVLMNKGSKFWQKNWEGHIDELQREFSGDLYKVILNSSNNSEFCCCPFSLQAYDYSVSKITMITSVALLIASFIMFIFYFWLIVLRCIKHSDVDFAYCESLRWVIGVMLLIASFLLSLCIFQSAKGNKNEKNILSRWINRDELQAGI